MELNLRKARKLESKITNYLSHEKVPYRFSARVKAPLKDILKEKESYRKDFLNLRKEQEKFLEIIFDIRKKIGEKNESCGINALMNKRALIISKIKHLTESVPISDTDEELKDSLDSYKKQLERGSVDSYDMPSTTMTINVFLEEDKEAIENLRFEYSKMLEEIDDELMEKNNTNKIELTEEDTELLSSKRLM